MSCIYYFNTAKRKMQVFFKNPAISSLLKRKNRLTMRLLSKSVETFVENKFRSIILIIIVSAGTLVAAGTADLDEAEDLGIRQLDAVEQVLDVAVSGGTLAQDDYETGDHILEQQRQR